MNGPTKSLDWKEDWKFLKKDVPLKGCAFALNTVIVLPTRATYVDQDGFIRKQEFVQKTVDWSRFGRTVN